MRECLALLLFGCLVTVALAATEPCDESTCTQECYPLTWERDLCQFYREVDQWRESALMCGLNIPPLPGARPGGATQESPDQQWRLASNYWVEITSVWEEFVEGYRQLETSNNTPTQTPSEGTSTPTTSSTTSKPPTTSSPQTDSSFLTPIDDYFTSESGEGSGNPTDFTTDVTMEMTAELLTTDMLTQPASTVQPTEPVTAIPTYSNFERWMSLSAQWGNSFSDWVTSSSDLEVPTGVGVAEIVNEIGEDDRSNRRVWSRLLEHWKNSFVVYEDAYGGVCPGQTL